MITESYPLSLAGTAYASERRLLTDAEDGPLMSGPEAAVVGHRDLPGTTLKACPCFDVAQEGFSAI